MTGNETGVLLDCCFTALNERQMGLITPNNETEQSRTFNGALGGCNYARHRCSSSCRFAAYLRRPAAPWRASLHAHFTRRLLKRFHDHAPTEPRAQELKRGDGAH